MSSASLKHNHQNLSVNGQSYQALVKPHETLLETLRYNLGLIGTKQGCDKGDCGACTVLMNNKPVLSCLSLSQTISEEDEITTIEGLLENGVAHLLVEAFDKCGALQCGFCQPGMILSAKALLLSNINPSLMDIKQALSGNLCRCTGYTKIYHAVMCASLVLNNNAKSIAHAQEILTDFPG